MNGTKWEYIISYCYYSFYQKLSYNNLTLYNEHHKSQYISLSILKVFLCKIKVLGKELLWVRYLQQSELQNDTDMKYDWKAGPGNLWQEGTVRNLKENSKN